ncbi:MAG TPA: S8 family serine peptidase, partial [Bacteroidia bacterium]|nr:S8 family serine peptidase [Bacteroidia bacterium]
MKKLLLVFFTACISGATFGQSNVKMDFCLASKQDAYLNKKADGNVKIPMLIQGNVSSIKQLVLKNGGTFKYSYGNIAAIIIPVSALPDFNASSAVTRMEGAAPRMHILDDSSNVKNRIDKVLAGQSPLPQAYTGKGVAMGFIDTGIDFKHPDFCDSSGTRVHYYWDQNRFKNGYTPQPYNYGQAWTKNILDSAIKYHTLADSGFDSASILFFYHGSNVAGPAVGNSRCNGHEIGACIQSDIIFVAYDFYSTDPSALTDAVQYIYDCADSLNEPCVINASLGDYDGSHDDSDLQGEMIDNMILAKQPGRYFVAAAGNSCAPYHVHDSLKKGDTTFTWFIYDGGIRIADIPIFANENEFKNVKFRLRCDKVQTGSYTERDTFTVYHSIKDYLGIKSFNVYNKLGQRLAQVQSNGSVYGNASYSLEFQIIPDSTTYYWGYEATDTGSTYSRFDIWDYGSKNGVVDSTGLNMSPIKYPEIKKYQQPDSIMTLCSSYQCSPHVITAQTYFNRRTFTDCNNTTETNVNVIPGAFTWYTSKGPTRNYKFMKSDVSAAGNNTLGALPTWKTVCNANTDALGCHNIDGGTSMASPMIASAVGLYLQKYPRATDSNVIRCIHQTAYTDKFTGPPSQLPNYNWGWGKV